MTGFVPGGGQEIGETLRAGVQMLLGAIQQNRENQFTQQKLAMQAKEAADLSQIREQRLQEQEKTLQLRSDALDWQKQKTEMELSIKQQQFQDRMAYRSTQDTLVNELAAGKLEVSRQNADTAQQNATTARERLKAYSPNEKAQIDSEKAKLDNYLSSQPLPNGMEEALGKNLTQIDALLQKRKTEFDTMNPDTIMLHNNYVAQGKGITATNPVPGLPQVNSILRDVQMLQGARDQRLQQRADYISKLTPDMQQKLGFAIQAGQASVSTSPSVLNGAPPSGARNVLKAVQPPASSLPSILSDWQQGLQKTKDEALTANAYHEGAGRATLRTAIAMQIVNMPRDIARDDRMNSLIALGNELNDPALVNEAQAEAVKRMNK